MASNPSASPAASGPYSDASSGGMQAVKPGEAGTR